MSDITPVEANLALASIESSAGKFAKETLLPPSEAFGKYVSQLIPTEATDLERIGVIQEAARRFNLEADDQRQITLWFHFTDNEGAEGIAQNGKLGKESGRKIYLSPITPELAKPLCSAEDARAYERYFRDKIMPTNLRERIDRFVLGLKFKWQYSVSKGVKEKLGIPIIPIGEHKLENVIIIGTERNNPDLKKDEPGEIYTEEPIKIGTSSEFSAFGPYKSIAQNASLKRNK